MFVTEIFNKKELFTISTLVEIVKQKGMFNLITEVPNLYELFSAEYISALSDYIKSRINPSDLILEVGAGDGRLAHFLRERGLNVVAIDNFEWEITPLFPVEELDYKEALKKYNPAIVICSWMPYFADWTPAFRNTRSVREYIIIGEFPGGCCGNETIWSDHEGFEEIEIDFPLQICRTDRDHFFHSGTFIFRRME